MHKSRVEFTLFKVFHGNLKKAPLIEKCPLNIERKPVQAVDRPANTFSISEIVNGCADENFLSDGKPEVSEIKPSHPHRPDNRFWTLGDVVGHGWKNGVKFPDGLNNR